ncbi:GcrA family cell cycle regulator [Caulobacter sp. S45]|jgi:GcrA cell cycle regulator|uniref:GcrA family cell cycle regulator n=1 Tax=Caulobacter sp. S45 TaxID=1641861 RepID=UPI00131A96CA|nr:GcrA family cell cycle regulator [Caulobacter sp. S45]
MGWTEDRVETLKKLWLDGYSASQIAKQLGAGLTRNAVIGKVHRLGLSGRAAPSQPQRPVFKATRPARPAPAPAPVARRAEPVAQPEPKVVYVTEEAGSATVLTLGAHMCKWPIGDPSTDGFSFCGRASGGDGPYCAQHAQVAYQAQPRKSGRRPDSVELVRSLRRYI